MKRVHAMPVGTCAMLVVGSVKYIVPCCGGALGDLPALTVDAKGNATISALAPRVSVAGLVAHS